MLSNCFRLRGQFGTDTLKNAVHGSSDVKHAMSSIQKIFGELYFNPDGSTRGTNFSSEHEGQIMGISDDN